MEKLLFFNLNKICRVCLVEQEKMYSIFGEFCEVYSEGNEMIPVFEILANIFSLKIQLDDGLPSLICAKCVDIAHTSFKFQIQCNKSQSILEAYMKQEGKFNNDNEPLVFGEMNKSGLVQHTQQDPDLLLLQEATVVDSDPLESDTDNSFRNFQTEISNEQNVEDVDPLDVSISNVSYILPNSDKIQDVPNEGKRYTCSFCEKSYKYANGLRVHMRNHTEERPYSCKMCGKSFKQYTSLVYHKRSHTGEQPYACKLCGKRYKQSGTLTAHMRVHTGQKPFLCSICGRGFRQAPDLGYHMRSHTKEKPYMCNICGKTMSMQSHLVQHMRTHTGERPYKCSMCEKAFPSSTRLKRHAIIHTSLKPYTCEVCSKSFNRMSSLKVHSKIHTDERAHICPICSKGFIQAHALRSHLMSHSSELVYLRPGYSVVG